MSMDATKNKDPQIDANAVFLSKIRRAKYASNKGRSSTLKAIANGTTKSDHKVDNTINDSSCNVTKKGNATMPANKSKATVDNDKYLAPHAPFLESLPDLELQAPVKYLASTILSTAIHGCHRGEALFYLINSSKTPRPAHHGFKLKSHVPKVKSSEEFKKNSKRM